MSSADTIFKAVAHPARRQIIALLSVSQCSVKELTRAFDISQPAVSQHLRELREARLVTSTKVGLEQQYRLTGEPLKLVFDWSSQFKQFFDPAGHAWAFVGEGSRQKQAPRQEKETRKHGR